jgi:Stress responsive A/B Barrel Domain
MICHSVFFSLKHPKGSPKEAGFLADALILAKIPGVIGFRRLRQTSRKTDFAYGFTMEFRDQAAYDGYDTHPDHTAFVRDRWIPEVEEFLELDFERYDGAGA